MDYRQYYKDYYKIEFGNDYVVHHIDGDRSNNEIWNLVLLPSKLHAKYHLAKKIVEGNADFRVCGSQDGCNSFYLQYLEKMPDIMRECAEWYDFKDYGYDENFDPRGFAARVRKV